MMLTHLSLRNFQAHAKLDIDLDPKITVLMGESDVGKSSVIRALRWLALNTPSGSAFIRHGKKASRVTITLDAFTLVRKRGKKNTYTLDNKLFTALGMGKVPDEVKALLQLDEVNFQTQHEPSFWMFKTPGEVSKELNRIINLGLIDHTLGNLASELRRSRVVISLCEERLVQARERKEKLSWVEGAFREFTALETLETTLQKRVSQASLLRQATQRGLTLTQAVQWSQEAALDARKVLSLGNQAGDIGSQAARLRTLLASLARVNKESQIEVPWEDFYALEKLKNNTLQIRDKKSKLFTLLYQIQQAQEDLCQKKQSVTVKEKELTILTQEITKRQCPLCGRVKEGNLF